MVPVVFIKMNSVTNVPIKTFADTNVYQYVFMIYIKLSFMIYIKLKEFPTFRGALKKFASTNYNNVI